MHEDGSDRFDLACRELVEIVTDYLCGELDGATSGAVEAHLRACPECREYLRQMRATVAATGRLRRESFDARTVARLTSVFRDLLGP